MGGDEFCFKRFFFALFLVIPPVIFRRRTPVAVIITMRPALVVLLPLVAAVQPQGPRLGLESFAKLFPTPAATAKPPVAASRRPATKRLTSTRPVAAPASPLSRLFAFNTRSTPPPIAVPTRAKGFQFGTAAPPVRLGLETLGPQRLLATLLVAAALGNAPTLENTPTLTTRTPYSVSSMMPTNDARFEAAMERQRARLVVAEESMRKYEQQVTAAKLKAEKAAESRAASREERLQRTIAQTPRVMEQQEIFPDSKRHSPADDTVAVDDAVVASELVAEVAPEVNVPKVMTQPMVDPLPNKVPAEALRPTQPGTSPTQAAATVLALGTVGIGGALLQARKNADGERTLGTLDAPFTTKTMMTPPENILGTVAARVSKPPPPRAPASTPPSGNVVRRAAAASSAEAAAQAAVEEIGDALKRAVEEARDRAARAEEEAVEGARSALEQKRREELLAEARAAEAERARAAEAALFEAVAEAQAAADALKAEEARIARARANAAATRNAKGAYLANADEKAQRLDGVKAAEELKRVAAAERRAMEEARVAREARAAFETAEELKRVAAAEARAIEEARVAREAAAEEARVAIEARAAAERAAAERAAAERAAAERAAAEKIAAERAAAEKIAAEKAAAEKVAAEKAAAEKVAAEKAAAEKIAAEKAAAEKIAAEKAAAEKVAAEKAAAEKIAAERAAAEKIAAERAAAEKAFAKAAAEKAAAEKIAADKADWADLKSITRATSKKPKVSPSPTPSKKAAPVIQKATVVGGGVEGAGGAPLTATQLNKLKVAELRSELASRGLDSKGIKATLVARLAEAIKQAQDAAEAAKAAAEAAKAAAATSKGSGRPKPVGFGQFVQPRKGAVGTKKRVKKWYDI